MLNPLWLFRVSVSADKHVQDCKPWNYDCCKFSTLQGTVWCAY